MPGALFLHSGFAWMLYNFICLPEFLKCYCRHCLRFSVYLWKDGCLKVLTLLLCWYHLYLWTFFSSSTQPSSCVSSLDLLGHRKSCCLLVLCMATFPCAGTSLKPRCFPQRKDGIVQWVWAKAPENGWNAGLTRDRDGWERDNTCNNICLTTGLNALHMLLIWSSYQTTIPTSTVSRNDNLLPKVTQ